MMKSSEIREQFLSFFENKGHTRIDSSSLVPGNDPTLLFTNSGMVQFKDIFLGKEKVAYNRAVSSQRCVRVGGKHNDLENVGYTARHHTFFEMLGNFSFGDYFKEDAIHYAWEFIVQVLALPPERLWITVFDKDTDSEKIWLDDIGVDPARFSKVGEKDNFWSMGEIGPCGPCTEIFYDHGEKIAGGSPGTAEQEGDRFVEIWNLVFMQYERLQDGKLVPLPNPSVDTGMGLERIAAVAQGVHSNYDTDLFRGLIHKTAELLGTDQLNSASLRVIADHIRACSFLIVDGIVPSNEARGYVLRRIIRRAVRHGYKLGTNAVFFYKLVDTLEDMLGSAYPELSASAGRIKNILKAEEERFGETLDTGLTILDDCLATMSGSQIPGEVIFRLYDTYGFPVDLTADIARERGLTLDIQGFETLMQQQQERARKSGRFVMQTDEIPNVEAQSDFLGYKTTQDIATVLYLFVNGESVQCMQPDDEGIVVLDRTPFYAEAGGQIGDTGTLTGIDKGQQTLFIVKDTQKQGDMYKHIGISQQGSITVGDQLNACVDTERREKIVANHSATHLLHASLRTVLGDQVSQRGSLVAEDRLRFDFSYSQPLAASVLTKIEDMVNDQIRRNYSTQVEILPKEEALKKGAVALFGEKYGAEVRVMSMGDFSVEFCGGTHVERTGDIGLFKVLGESGVAAGIRRIEAVTGMAAYEHVSVQEGYLKQICGHLKTSEDQLVEKVDQLIKQNKTLQKDIQKHRAQIVTQAGSDLTDQAVDIKGMKILAVRIDGADRKSLRDSMDKIKDRLGSAVVVLASADDNKVQLVAGVTKDCTSLIKAGQLANMVAMQIGGKGGGRRDDMAEAGGTDPSALDQALASVPDWVRSQLQ